MQWDVLSFQVLDKRSDTLLRGVQRIDVERLERENLET
jgi:hypothetical protein